MQPLQNHHYVCSTFDFVKKLGIWKGSMRNYASTFGSRESLNN